MGSILIGGTGTDGKPRAIKFTWIAEADLKLRGPGDLEGTQQSGVAFDLKIANIARDGQLLGYVRGIAERITDEDPDGSRPENALFWKQLERLRKTNVNWSSIS